MTYNFLFKSNFFPQQPLTAIWNIKICWHKLSLNCNLFKRVKHVNAGSTAWVLFIWTHFLLSILDSLSSTSYPNIWSWFSLLIFSINQYTIVAYDHILVLITIISYILIVIQYVLIYCLIFDDVFPPLLNLSCLSFSSCF